MMSAEVFFKGFAILLVQPWAFQYARDPEREALQGRLYFQAFEKVPAEQWQEIVLWWIHHEDHWPLIAELRRLRLRMFPPAQPVLLTYRDLTAASASDDAEPWLGIIRAWARARGRKPIDEIGAPILRAWLEKHQDDTEASAMLREWADRSTKRSAQHKHTGRQVTA